MTTAKLLLTSLNISGPPRNNPEPDPLALAVTHLDNRLYNREGIKVAISQRIGNLKNTHIGAHWRVPRQPYIGALMYGPSSDVDVWIGSSIHRSVHTSEFRCINTELV